jgi:Tfp pilus assembly major pilin PilA
LANISALITIRYYQDTTTVAEVDAFVSHSLVKENGQWKIKGIVMDRVATNQKIGVCPCKISRQSSENNNQYNAKVMYPNGNSFETDEYTISIKKESNFSIVTFGSNYYTWKDNIVYATKVEGNPTSEMLGKALTNNEVIVLILAKSLYVGQCRKFESLK